MGKLTLVLVVMAGFVGVAASAPVPRDPPPDPLARGYLGITVRENGLMIDAIQPHLPAARAGLRPGDKIVRVGMLEPQSFDQVVANVTSFRPGAIVEFEIERGSERKVYRITLTTRPLEADRPISNYPIVDFPDR